MLIPREELKVARAVKLEEVYDGDEAASADIFATKDDTELSNAGDLPSDPLVKDEDPSDMCIKPEFLQEVKNLKIVRQIYLPCILLSLPLWIW